MTNSEQTAEKFTISARHIFKRRLGAMGRQVSKLPSNLNTPQPRRHKTEPNGKLYQRIAREPTPTWSLSTQTAEKLDRQVSL